MIETKLNNLEINELTQEQYESAKVSGALNSDAFYMTEASEEIPVTPITKGGTNAQTVQEARQNLGFEYGEEVPTHIPETGDGAIYFKIDDNNGILPIEEGGTNAVTGHDALRNLGAVDYVVESGKSGIWNYRKWNSGKAECWMTEAVSLIGNTASGALMGGYYAQTNEPGFPNFPFTFKESYPAAYGVARLGTGTGFAGIGATSERVYSVSCVGNQNSTTIGGVVIRVEGTWK